MYIFYISDTFFVSHRFTHNVHNKQFGLNNRNIISPLVLLIYSRIWKITTIYNNNNTSWCEDYSLIWRVGIFLYLSRLYQVEQTYSSLLDIYIYTYIYYSLGWNLCSIYGVIYKLTRFFIFNTFVLLFSYIRFFITKISLHFHDKKNPYLYLYWKNNSYTTDLDFIVVIALLLMNINFDRFTIICNYFGNQTTR